MSRVLAGASKDEFDWTTGRLVDLNESHEFADIGIYLHGEVGLLDSAGRLVGVFERDVKSPEYRTPYGQHIPGSIPHGTLETSQEEYEG